MRAGFEIEEHTADLALRVHAETREQVFVHAAEGMFSLICDPRTIEHTETLEVEVAAEQLDLLLAAWLNELLYLFEARRVLFAEYEVLELDDRRLRARVSGEALDPARHAVCGGVKAATLHQLSFAAGPRGWEAFVILDV